MASIPDYQTAQHAWRDWSKAYNDNPDYRVSDKFKKKAAENIESAKEYLLDEIDSADEALYMIDERVLKCYGSEKYKNVEDFFTAASSGLRKLEGLANNLEKSEQVQALFDEIVTFGSKVDDVVELEVTEDTECPEEQDKSGYSDDAGDGEDDDAGEYASYRSMKASVPDDSTAKKIMYEWSSYSDNPDHQICELWKSKVKELDPEEAGQWLQDEIDSLRKAKLFWEDLYDPEYTDLFADNWETFDFAINTIEELADDYGSTKNGELIDKIYKKLKECTSYADLLVERSEEIGDVLPEEKAYRSYGQKADVVQLARQELGRLLTKAMVRAPSKKEINDAARFFNELEQQEDESVYGKISDILKGLVKETSGRLGVQQDGSIPKNNLDAIVTGCSQAIRLLDNQFGKAYRSVKSVLTEDALTDAIIDAGYTITEDVRFNTQHGTGSVSLDAKLDGFDDRPIYGIIQDKFRLEVFESGYDDDNNGKIYYVDFYLPDDMKDEDEDDEDE